MKILKLEKSDLDKWLAEWMKSSPVYAPVQSGFGSFYDWARLEQGRMPELLPGVPKSSIKTFLFPQPETLEEFSADPADPSAFILKAPKTAEQLTIIAGVRPCDARSVSLNALPYAKDPYYSNRLRNTALVGFTCETQCSTCFCTRTGGLPTGTEGLDIAITRMDNTFLAEILTQKGELLAEAGRTGTDAGGDALSRLEQSRKNSGSPVSSADDPAPILREKDLMALYQAPFWQEIAEPCLNCGACTFLCPTCYCFDIQDEVIRDRGRRIRYWDSCMFPLFTLHASGHNPRGLKLQRVRNRFMHKLKYFPERFGPISCVGCGRCIRECPVNIDIREVYTDLLAI
ncbi:MAG TPA: 4Fe-4S ferredoxin [Thermodesulfobacteriaceae bacterium]|nr:4Fe-4S ferredoxin [Thermodesulfobacteriaceae bacterium]